MSDILYVEQKIVAFFVANSGSRTYDQRFPFGGGHYVQVRATHIAGSAIHANVPVRPDTVNFSIAFWSGSDEPWFRIDNEVCDRALHFHLASGSRPSSVHIPVIVPLDKEYTVVDLVHKSFDEARQVLGWKYNLDKELKEI